VRFLQRTQPSASPAIRHSHEGTSIPSDPTRPQRNESRLTIRLARPRPELLALIKAIPGRQWHSAERHWTVPDSAVARQAIQQIRKLDSARQADVTSQVTFAQRRSWRAERRLSGIRSHHMMMSFVGRARRWHSGASVCARGAHTCITCVRS
jgi:hypothetical protein